MRCNLCDRVLDNLDPTLAVALLVLVVVERNDLVFEQAIDGSCVELILIALVLIGALLGESPTCALAIALKPPTVKH